MSDRLYQIDHAEQIYNGRSVLRVPSLTIGRGDVVALVGPSGAGKSTLLRLLAFLEVPAGGTVALQMDGRQHTAQTIPQDVRRRIAMVFQRPALLSGSVRKNVAYGLRVRGIRDVREPVETALGRVGLLHLANARAASLSGGEAQRVSLARALVLEPEVLILDEPTANLDPENISIIERLLREQHEQYGTTIVIVTHNIFQARRLATRVGLIYDGDLVEIAPREMFFNNPRDERTAAFTSGALVY